MDKAMQALLLKLKRREMSSKCLVPSVDQCLFLMAFKEVIFHPG
jgi:hypothetical protein